MLTYLNKVKLPIFQYLMFLGREILVCFGTILLNDIYLLI